MERDITKLKTKQKNIRQIPPLDFDLTYHHASKEVRSVDDIYILKYGGGRIGWSEYSFTWDDKVLRLSVEWMPKETKGRNIYFNNAKFLNPDFYFTDIHELTKIIDIICVCLAYHYDKGVSKDATVHLDLNTQNIANLIKGNNSSASIRGVYE